MARNRIGLQVAGFEDYMAKLDEVGGTAAMRRGVEEALKDSKKHVNPLIEKAMAKGNLPAKGRYSFGDTKESIDDSMTVDWEGATASIKVGFDFKKSGMKSIFLMYGTPKHDPVTGLYGAIYGTKTQKQIGVIQAEALDRVIREIMEE